MEPNSKKLERTSRIIYYSISLILCLFLILLSNRIIGDLDSTTARPAPENFENKELISSLERDIEIQRSTLENLSSKRETIEKTIAIAKENLSNEKQSFDNWLETRKTLGSPDKDKEVISRARKLDEFYKVEQDWRLQLDSLQTTISSVQKREGEIQAAMDQERSVAESKYYEDLKWYDLKVFLIRLLFVAPVLTLGIFFIIRYRNHKFWPLYFGFSLFSLYAFFFGLVPYLPSYGGYVRYTVGIILSAGLGYYAIKKIRQFIELRQAELKISTEERARKIQSETAEKAFENHFCPSCGKDFMLRKWEVPLTRIDGSTPNNYVTSFCRHCGLELFKNCNSCGTKNFAHLTFCSSCGTKQMA